MRRAARAAAARGRPLRVMFADEARFGRINRPRPCWAPAKVRPAVREYIYLYGAVCPKDGACAYLVMPTSNTECFQVFLDCLSRKFARSHILLVLDGAPNHRCRDLVLPDNISLLFLPPYSPELNPKENVWHEIREKISSQPRARSERSPSPMRTRQACQQRLRTASLSASWRAASGARARAIKWAVCCPPHP